MKKFCYIILAGLMLTAFASCNKQSLPEGELQPAKGIPMELEATIGGPQTKVEFYADGNVLKSKWSSYEAVSVITVAADGSVKTIDNFTFHGNAGNSTITLNGTFTGDLSDKIVTLYPAVEEFGSEGKYGSPIQPGSDNDNMRAIRGIKIGESYCTFTLLDFTQTSNGGTQALGTPAQQGATVMSGDCEVMVDTDPSHKPNYLKVTLKPLTSVFKVPVTFDEEYFVGKKITRVMLTANKGEDVYYFDPSGQWFDFFSGDPAPSRASFQARIYTGSYEGTTLTGLEIEKDMVFYIPFMPAGNAPVFGPDGADKLVFSISTSGTGIGSHKTTVNLENNVTLEAGKVYRFNTVEFKKP